MLSRTLTRSWARATACGLSSLTQQRCAPPSPISHSRTLRVYAAQHQQQQQSTQSHPAEAAKQQGEHAVQVQNDPSTAVQRQQGGGALARGGRRGGGAMAPLRVNDLMSQLQREMDSMFSMVDPFFDMRPSSLLDTMPGAGMSMTLPAPAATALNMDVSEDDKAYYVHAEVPGFSKDHIKVTISDDHVLTITGDMREEETGNGKSKARRMRMASFTRRLLLPEETHKEGIHATTKDGVLCVTVPKRERKQPHVKEIPVQ